MTKPSGSGRGMLRSGSWVILIKLINAFLGFATVTIFARFLPPETYGVYILALTVAQFLALPLQMGLPILLTREISIAQSEGKPEAIVGILSWSRRLLLIGTLVIGALVLGCYAIVIAAGWPILQDFTWPIVLLIVGLIPMIAEMKRVMGILNGYRRPAASRLPDGVIRPLLVLVAGGGALWFGWIAETGLLTAYLCSCSVAALWGWGMIARLRSKDAPPTGAPEMREAEWYSSLWPLTIFAAASTIKTYADVLMLGMLDTTEAVAFYRVASQIAAIPLLSQVAINAVLGPHMAALNVQDARDKMQRLAVFGSRIAFGITTVFTLILLFVGRDGFAFVFGDDYGPVFIIAVVLSFGMIFNSFFGGTTMLLNMSKREKSSARYALSTSVANIGLNLVLIPFFGALGAAIATVITTIAMQWLAWRRLLKDLDMRTDAFARLQR